MITSKKLVYVNSRNRVTGTDSKFTYKVDMPPHHDFTHICILQIALPKSWYTVQEGTYFTLVEDSFSNVVSLTPQNYNRRSLATELMNKLNAASTGNTYTVTFPNGITTGDAGKYIFTSTGPNTDIKFIFQPAIENSAFELLGFDPDSEISFTGGLLESKNVCKIQSEDVIRIHSNVCSNHSDDILLEVYAVSAPTFANITWTCPDVKIYSKTLINRSSGIYEFSITNEDDQLLDLNGLNVCFTLALFSGNTFPHPTQYLRIQDDDIKDSGLIGGWEM